MQLLIITLDDSEDFLRTLSDLKDHGMNGIVFPTTSLKHALLSSNIDAAPIFGSIGKLVKREYEASHTVLMLVDDENLDFARKTVREITHGLGRKGILFTVPVSSWEGLD